MDYMMYSVGKIGQRCHDLINWPNILKIQFSNMTLPGVFRAIARPLLLPNSCVLIFLVLLSIAIRLPFFFTSTDGYMRDGAVTFHDEAMFIQQGQEVLNGNLPYIKHWDNAPPLAWMAWAVIVFITGGNLVAFRVFGALYIALTGIVLYRTLVKQQSRAAGIWAGAFYIIFASTINASQSFTSEHLVGLPFAGLLYHLLNTGDSRRGRMFAIAFYTLCFMLMTNFIIMLPVVALVLQGFHRLGEPKSRQQLPLWRSRVEVLLRPLLPYLMRVALLSLSCFLGFGFFYIIYWMQGQHELLVRSVFSVLPLFAFDKMDAGFFSFTSDQFWYFHQRYLAKIFHSKHWLIPVVVTCFVVMLAGSLFTRRGRQDRLSIHLLLLAAVAFILPFYRGAFTNYYLFYTLQCLPVFCLIMGRMMSLDLSDARWFALALTFMGLSDATKSVTAVYSPLLRYAGGDEAYSVSYYNDRLYKVAGIINILPMKGRPMIVCGEDDILYTLTGAVNPRYFYFPFYPYSKALIDTLGVKIPPLRNTVLETEPVYIVGRDGDHLSAKGFAEIGDILQLQYIQVSNIEGTVIFVRKDAMQEME
jgi:hypothetical protein